MKITPLVALATLGFMAAGCNPPPAPPPQPGAYNNTSPGMGVPPAGGGVNQPAIGTQNVGSMAEQPRSGPGMNQTPMNTPNQGSMHAP
ncbi:MAG: hypothetical protein JO264_02750 [Acidisphaera sp.]|nr:hypothetical protein [Acidisphaera sp.]